MRLSSKRRLQFTGCLIALLVLLTRRASSMAFEFDSIDFIVATFRFSLEQVTPHMPGYILHVLLGRLIEGLVHNVNFAFVLISIFLSVGSTLFLWRAAFLLRGERVALIVAALWLTHPFFWFYGEVSTVYVYESFFASLLLMLGIGLVRYPASNWRPIGIGVAMSLATGCRQSSLLLFAPAVIYLFVTTKQSRKSWMKSVLAFIFVTALWGFELLRESGGLQTYLHFASMEHIYQTQSVIFGNPLREHLAVIAKIVTYLAAGSLPFIIALVIGVIAFFSSTKVLIKEALRSRSGKFAILIAGAPLLFYAAIYFMKAGYLLNVWPTIILAAGVLIDHCAIMFARRKKERANDPLLLSRPLITRAAISITSGIVVLQVIWFAVPLPGKDIETFDNANSQDSFSESLSHRYKSGDRASLALNRLFAYSSRQAVRSSDALNQYLVQRLLHLSDNSSATLLATWWSRHAYYYLPNMHVYDIRTTSVGRALVGEAQHYIRHAISDSVIHLQHAPTYLLIREDHPDLGRIAKQVRLRHVPTPDYLDIYEIMDSTFSLTWDGVRFVKE